MNKKFIPYIGFIIGIILLLSGGGLLYLKEKYLKSARGTAYLAKKKEKEKKVNVVVSKTRNIEFMYRNSKPKKVYLIGDFNKWQKTATPMTKDKNHKWTVMLKLRPGKYKYCFLVDGKWKNDPNNRETTRYKNRKVSILIVKPLK
ncbi:MAG: glycogen-binding domain-containing protein [Elusimicrobia bacterium]|nr:glycogen-binding domain-containing protein [Elusimicrobiota bacterium]